MSTYQTQAHAVTAKRRKAGRYPTKAQIMAGRKLISRGADALTRTDLELLATHPDMAGSQRMAYRIMAEALAE